MDQIRIYAPGSIGNVGPGLDILGLAVRGAGDVVRARLRPGRGVRVLASGHPELPDDPARHSAALAAAAVLRRARRAGGTGIDLWLKKGLPLSGGQGGSAASAVAGAVAANELIGAPLTPVALLEAALEAESVVAGRHLDNIAPSLLGGLILIRSLDPVEVTRLPVPKGLRIVLAKPDYELSTRKGRAALPNAVPRAVALAQAAAVATMVAGACMNDVAAFGSGVEDLIAEPARAPLLPGFGEAKAAALRAGALGCSISGSGPTLFAFAPGREAAERVGRAVQRAYRRAGWSSAMRIATPDTTGARPVR